MGKIGVTISEHQIPIRGENKHGYQEQPKAESGVAWCGMVWHGVANISKFGARAGMATVKQQCRMLRLFL